MFSIIGWLAAFLLGICGVPQAIMSLRQKHSRGISWSFIATWFAGEILMLVYILPMEKIPLILVSLINIGAAAIIFYYKIKDHYSRESATMGDIAGKLPKTSPYFYGSTDKEDRPQP